MLLQVPGPQERYKIREVTSPSLMVRAVTSPFFPPGLCILRPCSVIPWLARGVSTLSNFSSLTCFLLRSADRHFAGPATVLVSPSLLLVFFCWTVPPFFMVNRIRPFVCCPDGLRPRADDNDSIGWPGSRLFSQGPFFF